MKGRGLTKKEKKIIEDNYLLVPIKRLCKQMKRSSSCLTGYLKRSGLQVPEWLIKQRKEMGRFKEGNISFNKGKKQSEFMSKKAILKTIASRFKSGQIPKNHKPIGYERISVDGYSEVKFAEPNVFKLKHRIAYEYYNNVILSSKDIIRFKDGNRQNFKSDNLYKVDNATHLFENRFCDTALSKIMSGKSEVLEKALLQHPELLELKRTQIKLNSKIKKHENK